mgnify:CR=1 FL=1
MHLVYLHKNNCMKNKLPVTVFIGQEMDEQSIRKELADCLSKEKELEIKEWKEGFQDTWPVQRVYPLE